MDNAPTYCLQLQSWGPPSFSGATIQSFPVIPELLELWLTSNEDSCELTWLKTSKSLSQLAHLVPGPGMLIDPLQDFTILFQCPKDLGFMCPWIFPCWVCTLWRRQQRHFWKMWFNYIFDRSTQFVSKFLKAFCSLIGASVSLSSGYHPRYISQTGQLKQKLETGLRCLVAQTWLVGVKSWSGLSFLTILFLLCPQGSLSSSVSMATNYLCFELCKEKWKFHPWLHWRHRTWVKAWLRLLRVSAQ